MTPSDFAEVSRLQLATHVAAQKAREQMATVDSRRCLGSRLSELVADQELWRSVRMFLRKDSIKELEGVALNEYWFWTVLSMAFLAMETRAVKSPVFFPEHILAAAYDIRLLWEAAAAPTGPLIAKVCQGNFRQLSTSELAWAKRLGFIVFDETDSFGDGDRINPVFFKRPEGSKENHGDA